jgi:hypothetical protein
MEHHLTERELIEYRFRLTSDEQVGAAAGHLAGCAECRASLERLSRKFASLDLLREDVHASEELISTVLAQAAKPAAAKVVPFIRRPWTGAVAAVLLVGFVVLIGSLTQERAGEQEAARESGLPQTISSSRLGPQSDAEKGEQAMVVASKPIPAAEEPKALLEAEGQAKVLMAAKQPSGVVEMRPDSDLAPAAERTDTYAMAVPKDAKRANERVRGEITAGAAGPAAPRGGTGFQPVENMARMAMPQPPFAPASAIELVTLPRRETVQLTIYNSADLTLVRERRNLTLKTGWNWLQLMWANTLIDPTSLSLEPLEQGDKIDIQQLVFPARLRELGRWLIRSQISGQVPFEITYFTSGLSWRAYYMGTLSQDEKTLKLEGYVRVGNNSGEDYENAQTRLIVGQVHLLDEIRELAQRRYPYGSPVPVGGYGGYMGGVAGAWYNADKDTDGIIMNGVSSRQLMEESLERKEVTKEGLSEYFLYTIEGTETIPNEWGKRLLSFEVEDIAVENLYKYDEERWDDETIRFVKFANDKKHNLGQTPIPDGDVNIYGLADEQGRLSYVGGTIVKYIPVDEEIELNLGPARLVQVEPKLMDYKTESYIFDNNGNVAGWDEIHTWQIEMTNTAALPIEIEITRGFGTAYWTLKTDVPYEKHDATHARFKQAIEPASKRSLEYTIKTYHGLREQAFTAER